MTPTGTEKNEERYSDADSRFAQLTGAFLTAEYAAHPVMATAMGVHTWDDCLDNFNRFSIREDRDRARAYLHAIDRISLVELNAENRLDYRLARSHAQMLLSGLEQQNWPARHPDRYLEIIFTGLFVPVSREYAEAEIRAVSLLQRLRAIPEALQEARQNLKCPPRVFTENALDLAVFGASSLTKTLPVFFQSLRSRGLRLSLEGATKAALAALSEFARFLETELLPRSEGDFALGREMFDYHLRVGHLMDKDRENSDALLEAGQEILAQTRRELAELAGEIEYGADWKTLVRKLKREHPPAGELLPTYRAEIERARAFVQRERVAALPVEDRLVLMEIPECNRSLYTVTAYLPPPPFESPREGRLRVASLRADGRAEPPEALLQEHSRYLIPVRAVHLAYPGQHLQTMQTPGSLSRSRKHFAQSRLITQGWGPYSEELMWEQGFFADPRIRLMQRWSKLLKACHVVLDIQLHTRHLSFDQAAQFLQTEALAGEERARADVLRAARMPTDLLCPILGQRALTELRAEMRRRQGERFDLEQFHTRLLSYGSMPPALLREALLSVC